VVYLVDADAAVRMAQRRLFESDGLAVQAFGAAAAFLHSHDRDVPGCVVLDLRLPDLDGLALQQALLAAGCERELVFMTGRGAVADSVRAMKAGASDFLTRPCDDAILLDAVHAALDRDAVRRRVRRELQAIRRRLDSLTPREHEVLQHVVGGRLNKQIAADLGVAEKTIKVHRARAMEKMGASSLAELVRKTFELEVGVVVRNLAGQH
jgi:FixJ family two-component response regulator